MPYSSQRTSILEGKITCSGLVEEFLQNIQQNTSTNAFIEVYGDEARQRAFEIDRKISRGEAGDLAGLVFTVKDLLAVKNHAVTGGSQILKGYRSTFTATSVQHLLDRDAILIGRVNCDEFGMGSSNENSAYGPVRNFLDRERVPGGSSGGSAVAVQQGSCHISLGTDTGGSVRQPASFCGLYGLKPTYSSLSRWGLLSYASSFDTIGVLSNDLQDCRLAFEAMSSHDRRDSTSWAGDRLEGTSEVAKKWKLAYFREALEHPSLDDGLRRKFFDLIGELRERGHEVTPIGFDYMDYLLPVYYILTTAEASSNLSRYDGMRYGSRQASEGDDLTGTYEETRSQGFGEEVKRRIFLGTFVLSARYYDAYYHQAQKARRRIREETLKVLNDHDLIIGPVSPGPAFKLGEKSGDPIHMYLADLFTVHASVSGIPAISLPWQKDHETGLPMGLQAMAGDFMEEKLFAFGYFLQNLKE